MAVPVYLNMRATYWIKVFSSEHLSSEYKIFRCENTERAKLSVLLLNSSLFWWYWVCVSDCCINSAMKKVISFEYRDKFLFVHLPSGRKISYYNPKIVKDIEGKEHLTYEGSSQTNSGWSKQSTWVGKIVENIVQAIARDCLATAMLNVNYFGYKIVMHVHDKVIIEMPKGVGTLDKVLQVMRHSLKWAEG